MMQLIRGLHNLKPEHRGCALTIGNFDGIHRGHLALLEQLAGLAGKHQADSCLMTFDPLPHEFFSTESATPRLMNTREKLSALVDSTGALCPDYLLLLEFNAALSAMTAEQFVQHILVPVLVQIS